MSNSISKRYTDKLESEITDCFAMLCSEFDHIKTKYNECCLGQSLTPERLENLKKNLDALCGKSYQMHCHVSDLHAIEKVAEFCNI